MALQGCPSEPSPPSQDAWGSSRSPRRRADILVPTHLLGACDQGQPTVFGTQHIRTRVISGSWVSLDTLPCPLPSRCTRGLHTLLRGLFLAEGPVIQPQPVRSGRLRAEAGTAGLTRCGFIRKQEAGSSGGRHPLRLLDVTVAEAWGWGRQDSPARMMGRRWESTGRGENLAFSHLPPCSMLGPPAPSPCVSHLSSVWLAVSRVLGLDSSGQKPSSLPRQATSPL